MMKSRLAISILISVVAILVAIKAADIAAGHVADRTNLKDMPASTRSVALRERAPNLDTFVRPDPEILRITQNLEDKAVRFRTDADGFVVGPNLSARPVDVLFLGGSTTECFYVEESLRFPYRVSQLLKDPSGNPIRTLNGGVSGNNSLHSFIQLVAKGIAYRPKLVVSMENVNDLVLLTNTGSYWRTPVSKAIVRNPQAEAAQKNRAFSLLREAKNLLAPNLWLLFRTGILNRVVDIEAEDEWKEFRGARKLTAAEAARIRQDFRASLLAFIGYVKSWGGEPVLMTQFNRVRVDDDFVRKAYETWRQPVSYDDFVAMYKEFNDIIRTVATENDVFLIDLDRLIPPDPKLLYDAVHLNDAGSQIAADIISNALLERYPALFRR